MTCTYMVIFSCMQITMRVEEEDERAVHFEMAEICCVKLRVRLV